MVIRASLLAAALLVALAAAAQGEAPDAATATPARSTLRCDGTDRYFFDELHKAGKVGYGETWDETVCDEGVAVYAEGATSRWQALKRPRRPATKDAQALALVLPITVGGGLALVLGAAGVFSLASRLRRRVVLEAPCPACAALLPVEAGEGGTQLFCPMCGVACAIVVQGRGRTAIAHASPLR